MSATDTPQAATDSDELGLARLLLVDVKVRSLLMAEARRHGVTRMSGIPREDQSLLVTMMVGGAAATVLLEYVSRPVARLTGADAALGGVFVNAALRGMAGAPSGAMPLAGALMAFAVLSHSLRPAVAGSARGLRALTRGAEVVFGARSALIARPRAAGRQAPS
jgi:hypothetical protein